MDLSTLLATLPGHLAEALHALFQGICHQQPGRSFAPGGLQLPLCARCSGIWQNAAVALAVLFALPGFRRRRPGRIVLAAAFSGLTLFILETGRSMFAGQSVSSPLRYLVGAAGGLFVAVFLVYLHRMLTDEKQTADTRSQSLMLAIFFAALILLWATLRADHAAAWLVHALVATLGVFATITAINFVLLGAVASALHRNWPSAVLIAASAGAAVGEVCLLSFGIR